MHEERSPEQDEDVERRFLRSDQSEDETEAHRMLQRDEEAEDDDDEVEAHSMGRLSLPEDPNTRL